MSTAGGYPYGLGGVAVGPGGEVFGVLLQVDTPPGRLERALWGRVADSIELLSVSLDVDSQEAMAAAGISFEPPVGAHFVGPVEAGLPRVRMMGGQGPDAWYLDLWRVPLVGQRSPALLVGDQALATLQEIRLPEPVEALRLGGREGARVSVSVLGSGEPTYHVLAVRTDARTALLMIGRHEPAAGESLRDLCRSIAETATVDSIDGLVNVEGAIHEGRRLIREITEAGMTAALRRREGRTTRFGVRAPMLDLGVWTEACRRQQQNGENWWNLVTRWTYDPAWLEGDAIVVTEEWRLAEGGVGYRYVFRRDEGRRMVLRQTEVRSETGREVERVVDTLRGTRKDTVQVDDTFACGPVSMMVASRLAREPQPRPAILTGIDTFTAGAPCSVMMPLGRTPLPGSAPNETGWTVRVMADYDPSGLLVYFDDEGTLVATSYEGRQWRERLDEQPVEADETPEDTGAVRR